MFMSENETEATRAWSAIEPGHGVVAVDDHWAATQKLPSTIAHPTDPRKLIYVIEAYHAIHCLVRTCVPFIKESRRLTPCQKVIRSHYVAFSTGQRKDWPAEHDMHCFDTLRQNIMCQADDTLLSTCGHRDAGMNQTRLCRNWDTLRQWATDHTACYHDKEDPLGVTPSNDDRWEKCDGGDDGLPRGSSLE